MKKLLVLTILIMTLCSLKLRSQSDTSIVWINLEGSLYLAIPATNVDEIVKAEKSLRFYHKWYLESMYKENVKDSIITLLYEINGIQASSADELKELILNKNAIEAQEKELSKDKLNKEKKKGNKKLGVGALVGFAIGILVTLVI